MFGNVEFENFFHLPPSRTHPTLRPTTQPPTGRVLFFDPHSGGAQRQAFDYSKDREVREFTCAAFNPAGQTVVVGNFNRFHTYAWDASQGAGMCVRRESVLKVCDEGGICSFLKEYVNVRREFDQFQPQLQYFENELF